MVAAGCGGRWLLWLVGDFGRVVAGGGFLAVGEVWGGISGDFEGNSEFLKKGRYVLGG